ncbi:putative UV radiation resistance protein (UVRAG) [Aspergillus clavatus NRRL 1]|uniref:UV radiation resistance protein (UVRAG), putative n=1 Tax=Aspergillus clavatus (strain ATCC 1007 / CBS 513.65 / DSM 816 / NCTC 3887 / NRRL 1 / QM 1276 / 107) TaxID=344612 RepID=A1CBR6_ASPCL|nr:UV radiation resistance protein (UVRAG), putative [Aspergillus clavatus NRRL 1]EAW13184.1 UV radiation resistance protein (UVRAG), putative [Aspergillus clavatus NRRL 1]
MSLTANTEDGLHKDDAGSRREKPWLFPSNRKLRHLQGVSIRNLVITPPLSRARGKTIDDEEIPNSLQSPSKILAQSAIRPLHISRSFTNLPSVPITNGDNPDTNEHQPGSRLRRRSTLPWNDPNPRTRQVKLEDITKIRMADTWFSIHCDGIDTPIYVSEVVENATNPSFRAFDLNMCGPEVSRSDRLTLKLWAKSASMEEYVLLMELQLHLQSLQFLGKSLDSFHQPLPPNSVLFHLVDGVYTNLTDIPAVYNPVLPGLAKPQGTTLPTSSYDALMRLANLDECIQDALATREKLESQISAILEKNQHALNVTSDASRAQDRLALTKHAVAAERKQLRLTTKRKEELIASINARKEAMARGRDSQEKARDHLPDAQQKLVSSTRLLDKNTEEVKGQIRRICEDLLAIYPIEPIPDKPLAFTIAGLALPNSSFDDIDRDAVAAALGYTAHLVYLLSFYLSVPIPYPINPNLSNSIIQDPVSASLPQRTYPLYPVNVQYRFEYGVFLLNKDIEFLLNKQGLRVLDIRHTLPNLKYLLYVLTAGTSEIPARKAGGIRGLFPGRLTPSLSRRGSEDSVGYNESILPRRDMKLTSKLNGDLVSRKGQSSGQTFRDTAATPQVA